ncbi:MAG TPA: acetaldehyde dehydrogenase (acetylating) [Conexibacter sp.]
MSARLSCAILGSGNIGADLMAKIGRSDELELVGVVGIDPASDGLARARAAGYETSAEGIDWILDNRDTIDLVFEATSAGAHKANAPKLAEAGIQTLDLTPAKLGPGVVPVVNLEAHQNAPDINMITCGGQATIPMVAAVSAAAEVSYAEIVATISSKSAGPGTRANIDEFTQTTSAGVAEIGGARRSKAIIVLNPAEPEIMMRNTVFCALPDGADTDAIGASIEQMAARVAEYVPGYRLRTAPVFDEGRVAIFIEVEGAGDYLPRYAGNLDIMTAAAVRVGEELARLRAGEGVAA